MLNDLRVAVRNLSKLPWFAVAFILTLGLGIGANTAIFSVINGVLLRPLPYPDADRIMHLRQVQATAGIEDSSFSFAEVADYRGQAKTIDQFVEFGDWTFNVLGRGEPHRATGGLVTSNFFQMLGAHPQYGRMLVQADDAKGAPPVVVLTDAYWRRIFGGDPNVIGQTLDLTVKKAQIVGVLAPGAHYATQRKQDFYVNYEANDHYMSASMQGQREHRMTDVYARLAPGQTPEAAQAELRQIAKGLHQAYPEAYPPSRGFDVIVTPWKDELTARARPMLLILLVTTTFVLIIACANVGNLTLTRLVSRETEMSIRAALGAPTSALRRQLLAENLVLSVLGGIVGLVCAVGGLSLLISYAGRFTNRTGEIGIDVWVLGFTMLVAITIALLFAWAPRLNFVNDPARAMAGAGRSAGSPGRRRAQRLLVVSQLAASFMLLIGAGLLSRTLMQLYAVDPGFDLANVLSLQAPDFTAQSRDKRLQFSQEVLDRVKGQASVQNAAMTSAAPLAEAMQMPTEIKVDGAEDGNAQVIVTRIVSNSYFETVGTQIKAGRTFQSTDIQKAPPVVIISEAMAKYYFKDQNPIGRTLAWRMGPNWSPAAQIVGIAGDTHADGLTEKPKMTLYRADTQANAVSTLLVRTAGSAEQVTPRVVETIRSLDPNRPVDHVQTLEELRDETIAPQRLNATLIGLFALLALAIAMVGVGGVLAFSVSQRTNELGIRMALGAEPGTILRMILGEGAVMAAIGLVVGAVLSTPLSRMLEGLLFGVQPLDAPTITIAAAMLVAVALLAAWVPARRAMAVEPMVALRRD